MRASSASRSLLADVLRGAAAGAAATWVMGKATSFLYARESDDARRKENRARDGKTAYVIAAERAAGAAGVVLSEEERKKLGSAIHWMLGVGAGAVYGAVRNVAPRFRHGSGIGYGLLFWLVMDEAALTMLGITPPPQEFPWQTHARGVAGHLVFGAVAEAIFDVADLAA